VCKYNDGVAGKVGGMMRRRRKHVRGVGEGGGCRGGKPIIVQITGRLWIFYQASSAALSFSLFLSVYFCLSALVPNLNSTSTELY